MTMSSHISELKKKHEKLSQKIELIQQKPSTDVLEVSSLKKQKLQLKEEIERLSA
ncbi:hypothetical protein GCM10008927_22840 [Amylibacter ulvae]|uniref:DUF465 domain-containing protein n=1 Tax=Paramylibacter ulvae TaxID=1651968 RepID=A0ABQ3D3A3_9RHOB|nr:DUF465 domain-containing protein [Amylibacter ulvae]GHA56502.1 hypothetical protein GCM10008927_22840 [Amylibacter ulvae]